MTDEEITRLRTLAQAATPGPWQWDGNVCDYDESNESPWLVTDAYATGIYKHLRGGVILKGGIKCLNEADAAYIAAASPDVVLALLDRQQRAAPTYGSIAERAAAGKDAGLWQAAPSAEPVAWVDERAVAWLESHPRGKITTQLEGRKTFERPMPLYAAPPPAPSAEPVGFLTQSALGWAQRQTEKVVKLARHSQPEHGFTEPLYTTPPDHTAVMRQALEALEERYVGALRDNAIEALRAALGEKR
jgi:hypothetical protein